MKKKALLISFHFDTGNAIRVISSVIKKRYELTKLFMMDYGTFDSWKKIDKKELDLEKISSFSSKFEYIMISATSYHSETLFKICDSIKIKNSKVKIIIGGSIGTSQPEECLKHVDAVCTWEGYNILDLLDYFEGKRPKNNIIHNFLVKDPKIKTEYRSLSNYDDMPFPDYSKERSYFYVDGDIVRNEDYYYSFMNVETAKGCLYNCSFCSISHYNSIKRKNKLPLLAKSSMKHVISNLIRLKKENPEVIYFGFIDDNFFFYNIEEIKEFVDLYNKHINIYISFQLDPRSEGFIEKFKELSRLKCKLKVDIGIQSGSEKFNKEVYNRVQKNESIIENHKWMIKCAKEREHETIIEYLFIYANPLEKKEDVIDTTNLMLHLKGSTFKMYSYFPIPSTPLGERLEKHYQECSSFSEPQEEIFRKYSFYYFYYFYINRMNMMGLESLLPKKIKPNILRDILNNKLFAAMFRRYLSKKAERDQRRVNAAIYNRLKLGK